VNACTIADPRWLAHARVLAASYGEHHPGSTFTVLVLGERPEGDDAGAEPFRVVTPADLGVEDLDRLGAVHEPDDLRVALRPFLLQALLAESEAVAYLDPQMRVYAPLAGLDAVGDDEQVVLVANGGGAFPGDGKRPTPAEALALGAYSPGFMALHAGPHADALLARWPTRLHADGKDPGAPLVEVFRDWLDAVPASIGPVHVLRDPGLNVAYWNLPTRPLSALNGTVRAADEPLRLFDFADFDPRRPHVLSEKQDRVRLSDDVALSDLCGGYAADLFAAGFEQAASAEQPFTRLPDGTQLDRRLRRLYREGLVTGALTESLFTASGAERFYEWLNEPAKAGSAAGVTRYLHEIWKDRIDLRAAFVHLDGPDGPAFVGWAHTDGVVQVPLPPALLPPVPEHVATQRDVAEAAERATGWGVNVAGFFTSELGLGEAARLLTAGLQAAGVPALPVQGSLIPPCRQEVDFTFANPAEAAYPISIVCMNGDSIPHFARDVGPGFFEGRHTIALWWWELGEFPDEWKAAFEHIDEVWVASQQIYDAIAPGSPVPVVKVHLPVRRPDIHPFDRAALGLPEGFLFLYVYDYHSTSARKNPVGLVEAFKRAFPPGSGAKLALKCINAENLPQHHEEVLLAANGHPDVVVIDRYVSAAEKNAMIAACDCYVSLHRSEGFGLTPAEAMSLGKPVIATRYGGTLEFMTPENSYLVDYALTKVGERAHPYPPEALWADPDLDEAAAYMRHVFEHPEDARERGERAAEDIRTNHSPQAAGETMAHRLRSIYERLVEQRRASGERLPAQRVEALRARVERGPTPYLSGRFPAAKGAAWKPLSRVLRPYSEHQRIVDAEVVARIENLEDADRVARAAATARADAIQRALEDLTSRIQALQAGLDAQAAVVQQRLEQLATEAQAARAEHQALPYMADDSGFEQFADPVAGNVLGFRAGSGEQRPRYRAFTDAFRGPEERVRELQRPYLDLLEGTGPVLDVGCGRGELLDLLAERGIEATGVDSDAGMVEHCHAKGHTGVVLADGNEHLQSLQDASLGAIVSAEVIEHMPYDALQRFLELSVRKLRPGGVLLVETVNPHAVHAMKAFWVDPTHQHPLFPEVVLELCRIHGFTSAFAFHPNGTGDVEADRFREPVYAVCARVE
jgi:glycosyltransferase involved in cell wall biosynthesis/SAM-dependent methyltransferase